MSAPQQQQMAPRASAEGQLSTSSKVANAANPPRAPFGDSPMESILAAFSPPSSSLFNLAPFAFSQQMCSQLEQARALVPRIAVDVHETEGDLKISADIAGVTRKEDVDLTVDETSVYISAHVKRRESREDERVISTERCEGTCRRAIYVGDDFDTSQLKAAYANGALTVTIPRKAGKVAARRRIAL